MLSVKVSSGHRIGPPNEARRRLGIQPGDRAIVQIVDDSLVLRLWPERSSERMAGIGPCLADGNDPVGRIRRLRERWDAERGG